MRIPALLLAFSAFASTPLDAQTTAPAPPVAEKHLKNIRQLTFGGDNAEAYWSPNGKWLTFQSNNPAWGLKCDHIFAMEVGKAGVNPDYRPRNISGGKGRTTC
jgi:TolB protein